MIVVVNRQQYIHPLVDGAGVSHHCCVVVVSDVFGGGQSLVRSDVHYGWGDAATGHDVGIVWAASRLVFMRKIMRQSLLSLFWEIVDGEWVRRTEGPCFHSYCVAGRKSFARTCKTIILIPGGGMTQVDSTPSKQLVPCDDRASSLAFDVDTAQVYQECLVSRMHECRCNSLVRLSLL